MIILDQEHINEDLSEDVLLWSGHSLKKGIFSIPRYLEENSDRLRSKYLSFVYDLGLTHIGNKTIIKHLDIGNGFSYWWMNQISEKSPFKSPGIYQCLRLLALEEVLIKKKPHEIKLISSNKSLFEAIQRLCHNMSIECKWQKCRTKVKLTTIQQIYYKLPYTIQGITSFRHIFFKLPLKKIKKPTWFFGDKSIFFCSYFFNLDAKLCSEGIFYSKQWEELPKIIHKNRMQSNWIHHFIKSPAIPDINIGLKWANKFNIDSINQGSHSFVETYLTWRVFLNTIRSWAMLNLLAIRLRKVHSAFTVKNSSVWLWPLLRNDWKTSLNGPIALNNCLWVELFDSVFKDIPHQKIGLYLWENQGWEAAMVHAWRRHNHGEIIGVPHTTICYWHLNNFEDKRLLSFNKCFKPLPSFIAVNGEMARNEFLKLGYPNNYLVKVEALRFQYLLNGRKTRENDSLDIKHQSNTNHKEKNRRLLILGDFTILQTHKMLEMIEKALEGVDTIFDITLKPHPICPSVKIHEYPSLEFKITHKPLDLILNDFDMVFSSNSTSASIEALLCGLKVSIFLDGNEFNFSPLRNDSNVMFVNSADELNIFLCDDLYVKKIPSIDKYFWLNNNYSKWKRFLGLPISE
jgi:surface carbohydrate biosynthesis protein (TIGR04326 family)